MGIEMKQLWSGLKWCGKWCVIWSLGWWLVVWVIGSCQAHCVLGIDDLIPTADRWMASWAAPPNGRP
jgi:hypothetical protein